MSEINRVGIAMSSEFDPLHKSLVQILHSWISPLESPRSNLVQLSFKASGKQSLPTFLLSPCAEIVNKISVTSIISTD